MTTLWAKLDQQDTKRFHPLVCHCLDVATVVEVLWEVALPASSRLRWQGCLGQANQHETLPWLSFWAGLHDLGKASPAFQGMSPGHKHGLTSAHYPFPLTLGRSLHHSSITRQTLPGALRQAMPEQSQLDSDTTRALACALGGHHGRLVSPGGPHPSEVGTGLWEETRQKLTASLAAMAGTSGLPAPPGLCAENHAFFMTFAGLVSVADWIGSDERFFPFRPDVTEAQLAAYRDEALAHARRALSELGWTSWSPPRSPMPLSVLLNGHSPRPMQQAVEQLATRLRGPGLVLIEAPMGEGKTEAAFYLADRWNQLLEQRGTYVAMPTQATANAMFRRFHDDYLQKRFREHPPDLRLLHGQAMLGAEREQPMQAGQVYDDGAETPEVAGALVAGDWFGYRKRGLLGPLAVGTVDQALLSVLQTKHGFVRLFGLADKTVVLDEVHAFDTYTSTLMDRLLAWLAALGCSVVLLSATLPAGRRQALLEAYGADASGLPRSRYPRITVVHEDAIETESFAASSQAPVSVRWVPSDLPQIVEGLQPLLDAGGCVGWVCNTVGRAQDVYQELRRAFADSDVELGLFHARYPFAERARRERDAVRLYGKDKSNRPRAAILVATQVIEQSLDLDFDLLITDLAPVDLVLQRAGRLHRHEDTQRPAWLAERTVWLLEPATDADGLPAFGNSEHIYGGYLLLRSWLTLRDRKTMRVPDDVEALVESVYGEEAHTPAGHLAQRLTQARANDSDLRRKLDDEARRCLIGKPTFGDVFTEFASGEFDLADDDDPEKHKAFRAMTRYSDVPSVTAICLRQRDGVVGAETQDGFCEVDLDQSPGEAQLRALLDRGVSLSARRATGYLLKQDAPAGWRRSALLRHSRAVVFDEAGSPVAADCPLQLDAELGVVVLDPRREEP